MNIKEKALENLVKKEINNILEELCELIDKKLDKMHEYCKDIWDTSYNYSEKYQILIDLKKRIANEHESKNYILDYQDIVSKIIEI